jgi:hypothetical protein
VPSHWLIWVFSGALTVLIVLSPWPALPANVTSTHCSKTTWVGPHSANGRRGKKTIFVQVMQFSQSSRLRHHIQIAVH